MRQTTKFCLRVQKFLTQITASLWQLDSAEDQEFVLLTLIIPYVEVRFLRFWNRRGSASFYQASHKTRSVASSGCDRSYNALAPAHAQDVKTFDVNQHTGGAF